MTVGQQVLILFLLIAAGFVLEKKKMLGEVGAKACADISMYLAMPCVMIRSFQREYTPELLQQLGLAVLVSVVIHAIGIAIGKLAYRGDSDRDRVLNMSSLMSNAGFMALPLQEALLGQTGVFYGTAYVLVFNLVLWSYGQVTFNRASGGLSVKKMLLNPGTVGAVLALIVFLMPAELPQILSAPINHLASLNTPLPMLFIGYYLSKVDFSKALRRGCYYGASVLRLIVVPVVSIGVLYLAGLRGTLLVSMSIAACAPTAAGIPMFAARFQGDTEAAVNVVALSTIASLATMPVLVALCQMLPA